jgi:hypothetical protein
VRVVLWTVVSLTALCASAAHAQSPAATGGPDARRTETPEEIIVRGKRLADFRVEVDLARERAYAIFNEINSNDDFDIRCRDERRYHSRAKRRVCRAQFETRISADTAKEYMATLSWTCPAGPDGFIDTQACMFSGPGQNATARAQAVEGQAPPMQDRMNDEILRLARTDLRFGQAILDFFEASQEYEAARERRED